MAGTSYLYLFVENSFESGNWGKRREKNDNRLNK